MKKVPLGTKQPKEKKSVFGPSIKALKTVEAKMNQKHLEQIWGALLRATWEYIGNDIMSAVQEEGKDWISRDDLIEVVLDADHMNVAAKNASEKEALKEFDKLSYKEKIKFAKTVFIYERWS